MEKKERKFYVVLAKNISSEKTDRIKDILPVICEEVNGVLEEILTSKKVYYTSNSNGLVFNASEFSDGDYNLVGIAKYEVLESQIGMSLRFKTEADKRQEVADILELEKLTLRTAKERLSAYQDMERKMALEFGNAMNTKDRALKFIPYDEYLEQERKSK